MKENLKQITSNTINFYIEQNLDDFYINSSQHPNFISRIEDKISWILARNADWPDCIFRVNFENLNMKSEIKEVKNLIRNGKAPNGWTVGPLTRPRNLGNKLMKYGFSDIYHQVGMAIELKYLDKKPINANKLIIQKIENKESLIQWSNVVSEVFNLKLELDYLNFLFLQKEAHFYVGNFEEKVVSALLLYTSSGVAGLHAVSTLSEYRNHGFGLAISRSALIDAYKKGLNVGVLQASSLGERIYRKLGFHKFCDIISYALIKNKSRIKR